MQDDVERLKEIVDGGACCAVALVQAGLELKGEKNELLLQAVSGLCGGVRGKLLCGALTGAACMLNILDPEQANAHLVPELVQWFEETVGAEYGGLDCADIRGGFAGPGAAGASCSAVIEATYLRARELLRKYGREFP